MVGCIVDFPLVPGVDSYQGDQRQLKIVVVVVVAAAAVVVVVQGNQAVLGAVVGVMELQSNFVVDGSEELMFHAEGVRFQQIV